MPINLNDTSKKAVQALSAAFRDGDDAKVEQAVAGLRDSIAADVTEQYRDAIASNDATVLAQRGFRQLTSAETAYYNGVIDALSSNNPKQALTDFNAMPDKAMPTTVFEQVMKDIQLTHPLLAAIPVVTTGYITEWVKNKHSEQLAAWGNVGDAITKEITSAFEVIDIKQSKLSCFAVVSLDMLKLGPVWMDGYVRAVLGEAMACGLEHGIIDGMGAKGEPIGLDRDIHNGVSVNTSTGYPLKTATKVTDFEPATYGALVAKLAKTEAGKQKAIDFRANGSNLLLICSPTDYLTKVMPATTVQNVNGQYVNDLLPLPTNVITSTAVSDGKAILALADEYGLFVAGSRGIEYSDEFQFTADTRTFKQVSYAFGRAEDNNSAILLDISGLEPAYVNVKVKGTVNTKASA
ncbi:phage major capsid protein [Parafannyhessea umbonata]|uniref:phage major capsid protein n=1 Tax=Parafannyhessea umbonata TaxID=604330 RepID=UPI003F94CC68